MAVVCECGRPVKKVSSKIQFGSTVVQFKCPTCGLFDVWVDRRQNGSSR